MVLILVFGQIAWHKLSQMYDRNVNTFGTPGGRLHDYFNGVEKEVFLENFTPSKGDKSFNNYLYVRVRIDEYMQVGSDGSQDIEEGTQSWYDPKEVVILRGDKSKSEDPQHLPLMEDKATWDTYIYDKEHEGYEELPGAKIREYYDLILGGSTVYMPTFNLDSRSETPDYNGELVRVDVEKDTQDEGFKKYTTDPKEHDEELGIYHTYTEDERYYYNSSLVVPVDHNGNRLNASIDYSSSKLTVYDVVHTAKETLDAQIMSMEEWQSLPDNKKVGEYWVFDVDGWAYWASPLPPETATGLIISEIELLNTVPDASYYAINVISQIATAGDWQNAEETQEEELGDTESETDGGRGLFLEGITEDGLSLLDFIATPESVVSIEKLEILDENEKSLKDDVITYKAYDELILKTKLSIANSTDEENEDTIIWTIKEVEGNSGLSVTSLEMRINNGVFCVPEGYEDMIGCVYEITATSGFDSYIYDSVFVRVFGQENAWEIKSDSELDYILINEINEYVQFECYDSGTLVQDVTWSVKGSKDAITVIDRDTGRLIISRNEIAGSILTVTATSIYDKNVSATFELKIYGLLNVDAVEFYIISTQDIEENGNTAYLLYSSQMLGLEMYGHDQLSYWDDSVAQQLANDWIKNYPTLKDMVIPITTETLYRYDSGEEKVVVSEDSVFLFSDEEFEEYIGLESEFAKSKFANGVNEGVKYYFLRNGRIVVDGDVETMTFIDAVDANVGTAVELPATGVAAGLRLAMWVYL